MQLMQVLSDLDIPPPPCKVELQLLCHARCVERVADDFWELLGVTSIIATAVRRFACSDGYLYCREEHNALFVLRIWSGTVLGPRIPH